MKLQHIALSLAFTALLWAPISALAKNPTCDELGFTSLVLCSDCKQLESFVNDADLLAECQRCCADDSGKEEVIYTKAILEVCPHSIRHVPHIEAFVKSKAIYYPGLELSMRVGMPPRLIMIDGSGAQTVVHISKWNTETIEEYLRDKLKPSEEAEEEEE